MTLDEQIAYLETVAAQSLSYAKRLDAQAESVWAESMPGFADGRREAAASAREDAATLLTIENTLRAMRDAQR